MKFLITGASGFIGRRLAERLVREGHQVVLIGRTDPRIGGANFVEADITDIKSLDACAHAHSDTQTVIHMAALVPRKSEDDQLEAMIKVNVGGTANILSVFGEKITNFVYASTAEVYGLSGDGELLNEESTVPKPLSYYGVSKLAGEHFCMSYGQKHGLPVSALRFTVLYGSGDTITRAIPNFINKALKGENLEVYGGEELRDYLHVSDAINAVYLAGTKHTSGIFNIATGKGITIADTAKAIIQATDPSLKVTIVDRQKKASDIVLDVQKAKQKLGFESKHTFPELIEEQIKWHKKN